MAIQPQPARAGGDNRGLAMRAFRSLSGIAVALFALQTSAVATPLVFHDRTAWETAAGGGVRSEGFGAVPVGALSSGLNTVGRLTIDVTGAVGNNAIVASDPNCNGPCLKGEADISPPDVGSLSFDFTGRPIVAFGGDWGSTLSASRLSIKVGGINLDFDGKLSDPGNGFLGFVLDAPADRLDFEVELTGNETFTVDDFSFKTVIDEPPGLALLFAGCVAVAGLRRRLPVPSVRKTL